MEVIGPPEFNHVGEWVSTSVSIMYIRIKTLLILQPDKMKSDPCLKLFISPRWHPPRLPAALNLLQMQQTVESLPSLPPHYERWEDHKANMDGLYYQPRHTAAFTGSPPQIQDGIFKNYNGNIDLHKRQRSWDWLFFFFWKSDSYLWKLISARFLFLFSRESRQNFQSSQ